MAFRTTFFAASVGAAFGVAAMMPAPALAQFGPPPGPPPGLAGPPPGLAAPPPGLGGPPPGLGGPPQGLAGPPSGLAGPNGGPAHAGLGGPPKPGGGAPRFSRLDGPAGGRGVEGRSAALEARSSVKGYARDGYSRYDRGRGRYWPYGAYAYGSSYASGDEDCYYTSNYSRGAYRRVLVCN